MTAVPKKNRHGWRTTGVKTVYKNPWLAVREYALVYPNGRPGIYGVVEKNAGVAVIALNRRGEVWFTRQYRYTVNREFLELPAGALANGEPERSAARRELFEETGIKAKRWTRLGNFFTALGHENAEIIAYLAEGLDESGLSHSNKEHDEGIVEVVAMPVEEVRRLVRSNRIHCGITLAALNLFFLRESL